MNRYCLVTGGAGYIGSHFCKALSQTAYTPVVFDNLSKGRRDFIKWGPLVEGDIRDDSALDAVFKTYAPEAVFHFAASIDVAESVAHPEIYYDNNTCGSLHLLDAMRRNGCGKLVFSSTAATYGMPSTSLPITETTPQQPINPYGWSKLFVEQMIKDYAHTYGLRFAILRYFNASGTDVDGEIGEPSLAETHLIPLVIQAATGARPDIKIFGTDYPTPDGTAVRDYIHVSDLADAHIKAMEALAASDENFCLNLGTSRGFSVKEVIDEVKRVTRTDINVVETGRRAGDPAILVASNDAAKRALGWEPRYSAIENIIETTWRWHQQEAKTKR